MCSLLSYARQAWDVVHRIAHHAQKVDDLLGPLHTEFRAHLCNPHDLRGCTALCRFVHKDLVGHQLTEILVRGHHIGGVALGLCFFGQCSDHIIGFIAVHSQGGDTKAFQHFFDQGRGYFDGLRGLIAVGLVLRILFMPLGRRRSIEHHRHMAGVFLFQKIEQSQGKAKDRRGVHALGSNPRIPNECEIRTKDQGIGIQQKKALLLRHRIGLEPSNLWDSGSFSVGLFYSFQLNPNNPLIPAPASPEL
ncbi:MAG: Uncharacterised protein [Flavobacteriia bacterium]|nr:MAG: Uncharacterised protein [Flavobacteriia bacterium]